MKKTSFKYNHVRYGAKSSICREQAFANGFSIVELVVVIALILIILAVVAPQIRHAVPVMRARGSANELSGLMQNARILAAKNNQTYDIQYTTIGGDPAAFIDVSQPRTGVYAAGDPVVVFNRGVTPAAGAPSGTGGQPSAYVLTGDTTSGTPYDNTATLAFNPRGLPCNYTTGPATCLTPSSTYFVYYLNSAQSWSAVVVTKGGRTRVVVWDGASWSN